MRRFIRISSQLAPLILLCRLECERARLVPTIDLLRVANLLVSLVAVVRLTQRHIVIEEHLLRQVGMLDRGVELRFDLHQISNQASVRLKTLRLNVLLTWTERCLVLGRRGVLLAVARESGHS